MWKGIVQTVGPPHREKNPVVSKFRCLELFSEPRPIRLSENGLYINLFTVVTYLNAKLMLCSMMVLTDTRDRFITSSLSHTGDIGDTCTLSGSVHQSSFLCVSDVILNNNLGFHRNKPIVSKTDGLLQCMIFIKRKHTLLCTAFESERTF